MGIIVVFGFPYLTASRQVAKLRKELTVKKEQLSRVIKPVEELARLEKRRNLIE